jgi:hypothetical protein
MFRLNVEAGVVLEGSRLAYEDASLLLSLKIAYSDGAYTVIG